MEKDYTKLPTAASFIVTENCNLGCLYCFENQKNNKYFNQTMTVEVIHQGLDMLCKNAVNNKNAEYFHAMIFGGEPLLRPDLVREICEYGYSLQQKHGKKFTATVVTNGTQMNDEIMILLNDFKNKIGLTCQLSIDGAEYSHNLYRKQKNGDGSFLLIEKNIEKFKTIYKDQQNRLSIHGCINRQTLPYLFENYKYFQEEWKIKNIWFMPVHEEDWQESDVRIYREQLFLIADYMLKNAENKKDINEFSSYTPINKCLMPYKSPNRVCGMGINFISITPNGDIYPCHYFYFNKKDESMKLGDIWQGINEDNEERRKILTYMTSAISCSDTCEHVNCYRCMGVNWMVNGDPLKQVQGNYCKMSKVEKEVTDHLKNVISNLDFVDLKDVSKMKKEKEWVQDGHLHISYINQVGENHIEIKKLEGDQEKQVENYYKENGMNILAEGMRVIIEKINNLENQILILTKTIEEMKKIED